MKYKTHINKSISKNSVFPLLILGEGKGEVKFLLVFISPHNFINFCLLFSGILFFSSCNIINPDEDIPSYLMVEKIVFTSKISDDVNSQNISDVWVYIDDDIIGAFELPAKIPILKEGKHKLTLRPGIKLNGIDATRAIYSLYSSLDSNIILEPDKILKVNFNTTYVSNLNTTWQEDFENPNFSLVKTERSDTTVKQAKNENYSYFEYGEKYAGRVYINTDKPYFELVCDTSLTLPKNYKPVYLEMDYKTSCDFTVSLKITTTSQSYMQEYLTITAAPYWRKIYINLTPYANLDSKAKSYKLYFSHRLETGKTYDELFFDNLKLVTTK